MNNKQTITQAGRASGFKTAKPVQSPEARHEAVFTASRHDKSRQPLKTLANRTLRHRKAGSVLIRTDDWILVAVRAEEDAIVDPLRLDEFELPSDVGSDEGEHQSSIRAIVLENSVRQERAVSGSAADHSMQLRYSSYQRIPWICATDV
jgi:hypothetical protein